MLWRLCGFLHRQWVSIFTCLINVCWILGAYIEITKCRRWSFANKFFFTILKLIHHFSMEWCDKNCLGNITSIYEMRCNWMHYKMSLFSFCYFLEMAYTIHCFRWQIMIIFGVFPLYTKSSIKKAPKKKEQAGSSVSAFISTI